MSISGNAEGRVDGDRLEARESSGRINEPEFSTVMCLYEKRSDEM